MEAQKFANIYDNLNSQPHLQEIIKNFYYDELLKEEEKKNKFHVIDTLNYAFNNARRHQEQIYDTIDENYFLRFIRHSVFYEIIGKNKFGPIIYGFKGILQNYYGDDFNDYFKYEYGDIDADY